MGDREYRKWLIRSMEIIENYWILHCKTEKNTNILIRIHQSVHNAKWLSEIFKKPYHEWDKEKWIRNLNIPVEAIINVWKTPQEIAGQEEFRGFRINREYYLFETSYSIIK